MPIKLKQRCAVCKKNYVVCSNSQTYVLCYDCQKKELEGDITDPKMKKLFDIPEDFYKESFFLRDIKRKYLKGMELTEKQIAAFKRTVEEFREHQHPSENQQSDEHNL